jgi:glycosyltransferase involved in cell wall biosynthesis
MLIVSVTITDSRENEISDAIRSVAPHVDKILVVDTGIEDKTLEKAKEAAEEKLVIVKHKWRDFSTARNASIDEAKSLGADWVLIVDTDERIHFGEVDLRASLSASRSEIIMLDSSDGHYVKEKIISKNAHARYVGPTHEALLGGSREKLHGMTFFELDKSAEQLKKKFTRDAEILADYVGDHPEDPRWWFYLGLSLEGLGKRRRSANAYRECADRRKYGDEAAWASYKQAEQLIILEEYEAAIAAAGRGLGSNIAYAECAWIAAVAASRLGRPSEAASWARVAEALGRYKGCGKERSFFQHLPALYELPYDVLRFTLPTKEERELAEEEFHKAKRARVGAKDIQDLDRISILPKTPKHNRDEARKMLRPKEFSSYCPSASLTRIGFEPTGPIHHPMNPSISFWKGELYAVVRCVNYTIHGKKYEIDDPEYIVRTANYLGVLQKDGKFEKPRLIHDLDPAKRQSSRIVGYEDIRLCVVKDKLTMSSTVCDRDPARRQIARLHLTPDGDISHAEVQQSRQWHEKNWMPICLGNKLSWIYSIGPSTIVVPTSHNVMIQKSPLELEHLRGGAAIPFEGGWLAVTHEAIDTEEKRIYLHRFVQLDESFRVSSVSQAFLFHHHGIEFCAGMAKDDEELILTYGVEDKEAWVLRVRIEDIQTGLHWITPP